MDSMSKVKRRMGSDPEIEDQRQADIEHDEYISECVDCLLRAEEIRQDSKLMEEIMPKLQIKEKAAQSAATEIKSLGDLRKLASKKGAEEYDQKIKSKG